MKRYLNFDVAKAICIILVVIGHYFPDSSPSWYVCFRDVIYSFHMPLFMFASGFVYIATKREDETYIKFVTKKFKRLMLPYFTTSFIVITLKLLCQGNAYVENPVTFASYLKVFYSPEAGFFLWFIWALWWMFLIVPLFKTKRSRISLFIVALFAHFCPVLLPNVFCLKQLQQFLVYFMLGVIIYDLGINTAKNTKGIFSVLFVDLLIVISRSGFHNSIVSFFIAIIGVGMVVEISNNIIRQNINMKLLLTVSASSYIIYLFHTTFEGFAKSAIKKSTYLCDGTNGVGFFVGALIVVTIGVVMPILLHKYILDRFQYAKLLFGLK